MILTEKIGIFRKLLRLCRLKSTTNLFDTFYAQFDENKFKVWAKTITEFERIIYNPKKVDINTTGDDVLCLWGKVDEFSSRIKKWEQSGQMTVEIDPEMVHLKYGKKQANFRNIAKSNTDAKITTPESVWLYGKNWDDGDFKFPEKEGTEGIKWNPRVDEIKEFAKKGLSAEEISKKMDYNINIVTSVLSGVEKMTMPYCLDVNVDDFVDIINDRKSLVNPSHFKISVTKDGIVSLVVSDDDEHRAGDNFVTEIGKINYTGEPFENIYRTGFENIFLNLIGKAFIYFGVHTSLVIHQTTPTDDKKAVLFDACYLISSNSVEKKPEPKQIAPLETKEAPKKKPAGKKQGKPKKEEESEDNEESKEEIEDDETEENDLDSELDVEEVDDDDMPIEKDDDSEEIVEE